MANEDPKPFANASGAYRDNPVAHDFRRSRTSRQRASEKASEDKALREAVANAPIDALKQEVAALKAKLDSLSQHFPLRGGAGIEVRGREITLQRRDVPVDDGAGEEETEPISIVVTVLNEDASLSARVVTLEGEDLGAYTE